LSQELSLRPSGWDMYLCREHFVRTSSRRRPYRTLAYPLMSRRRLRSSSLAVLTRDTFATVRRFWQSDGCDCVRNLKDPAFRAFVLQDAMRACIWSGGWTALEEKACVDWWQ